MVYLMKKIHFSLLIITLVFCNYPYANDLSSLTIKKFSPDIWNVITFTRPGALSYRAGINAKQVSQKSSLFLDFSPLYNCSPDTIIVKRYIGNGEASDIPFLRVYYRINKEKVSSTLSQPKIDHGFLFLSLNTLTIKDLLDEGDKGNISVWIDPKSISSTNNNNRMFFSLNGFPEAYNRAIQTCKDHQQ
ncbi:hypothetical protein DOQ87_21895 [Salmonella enterica subsp. enterica serovar Benin]|nr:hypothetical protein [Salmonella enterica subsp. enterica serovar Benin]ECB2071839.1 hypothetical protein [Salmonella enterica subsp. enterica serovar Benin]ECE9227752.1 hypothetical protein [Salmonella enterica subsp. enterica serovar Benin]OZU09896.1 hypothetical protein CCO48_25230 [Salmonella enterica subsp. enterica serovar Altendorf]